MNIFEKERQKLQRENELARQMLHDNLIKQFKTQALPAAQHLIIEKAIRFSLEQAPKFIFEDEEQAQEWSKNLNMGYSMYKSLVSQ